MPIVIRPIAEADRSEVLEMMNVFYASPAVATNGSREIFEADISACVEGSPYLEGYVFCEGAAVLGYAMLAKSFSTEYGRRCIWIEDIYVKPEARSRGIGRRFLAELDRRYPDCMLRLEVEEENPRAIRLYESCGFDTMPYMEMKKLPADK